MALSIGTTHAREIPSAFLQEMLRAETANPAPSRPGMAPLSPTRIAGLLVQFGHTPIDLLSRRLGVPLEHQGDAGDSVTWFCVRLDVPAGTRSPPREPHALSLWLVSDASVAGAAHAANALALDAVGREARRCPAPAREVELTLDPRIARPGASAASVEALYGHAPPRSGRGAYTLPGMQPDLSPPTLTLSMRNNHVETIWLAATPDN